MCVNVRYNPQKDAGISSNGWWWGVCMYLYSFLLSLEWASSKLWHERPSTEGMVGMGSQLHSVGLALDAAASRLAQ